MAAAAGSVQVVLTANTASYSADMAKAARAFDNLSGKAKEFSHTSVSSMQSASAAIRLFNDPLGSNIRAIERLISQSKVLSGVLKAAFPLVGAVAIGAMLAKLGTEVGEFIEKVKQVPRALQDGFQGMASSSMLANDQLSKTNHLLEDQIAKLERKPATNGAAEAMDDARIAAGELFKQLDADNKKLEELLKNQSIGVFGSLMGKGNTEGISDTVHNYRQQMSDLAFQRQQALRNNDQPGADNLQKQYSDKRDKYKGVLQDQLTNFNFVGGIQGAPDETANKTIAQGELSNLYNEDDHDAGTKKNKQLEDQKKNIEANKALAEQAKAAAAKAAETMLRQFETSRELFDQQHGKDIKDDYDYWVGKMGSFTKGSSEYNTVVSKQTALAFEGAQKAGEAIANQRAMEKENASNLPGDEAVNRSNQFFSEMGKKSSSEAMSGYADSNALALVKNRNAEEITASQIQDAVGSSITKVAAASALAALHTKAYNQELTVLQSNARNAAAALNADPTNKGAQKSNEEANAAIDDAQSKRQIQMQSDQDAQYGKVTSGVVGFQDALNDFTQSTRDNASSIRELTNSTLSSLNGEIVKAISGQRTNFGNMGAGIFRNVAGAGLQKAEGSVMGALGFGKPDGSSSKPLYVKMVDGVDSMAASAGSWISKLFGHGSGSTASSSSDSSGGGGGLLGGLGSVFMSALPMLASGGPLSGNTMAIVGERGPELFMPSSSGTVIPNHQIGGYIGGVGQTIHIDASSSTDPAQTKAQVMHGIQQAAPHIIASGNKVSSERAKRSPASSGRR